MTEGRDGVGFEMGEDLCDHLRVFYSDRQVLLTGGFPIHKAVLIGLIKKPGDCSGINYVFFFLELLISFSISSAESLCNSLPG